MNIFLTFHREKRSVVVFSFGVDCLALVGAAVFKLNIVQVKMSPCRAHLVIRRQLSIELLPHDLWDGAGKGQTEGNRRGRSSFVNSAYQPFIKEAKLN